jgi:hypothetical protein
MDAVSRIRWLEANVGNLQPIGRNGMHKYNNQDHSMVTARLAVENLFGGHHDVWSVNTRPDYHEERSVNLVNSDPAARARPADHTANPHL